MRPSRSIRLSSCAMLDCSTCAVRATSAWGNAALLDAASLAERLLEKTDVAAGVSVFEAGMFDRLEQAASESADTAATFLSHDSLADTLAMYRERMARMEAALHGARR